jgi:hypothetical protein
VKRQQSDAVGPYRDQKDVSVCVLASGIDENLLTVATAPGCQTQRGTATASYSQIAGPRSPRVFVVKPQQVISPVAKVPQVQVKGKGRKIQPCLS